MRTNINFTFLATPELAEEIRKAVFELKFFKMT